MECPKHSVVFYIRDRCYFSIGIREFVAISLQRYVSATLTHCLAVNLKIMSRFNASSTTLMTLPEVLVLDTCVLMHTITRKLILRLAQANFCQPVWGDDIGVEWLRNAPRIWKVDVSVVEQEWQKLQDQFPQANMGNVEAFKAPLKYSDHNDWHVIACALAAKNRFAHKHYAVITWNIKDFNRSELRTLGLNLFTPDQYLSLFWPSHEDIMLKLFEQIDADLNEIGRTPEPVNTVIRRDGLYRLNNLYSEYIKDSNKVQSVHSAYPCINTH